MNTITSLISSFQARSTQPAGQPPQAGQGQPKVQTIGQSEFQARRARFEKSQPQVSTLDEQVSGKLDAGIDKMSSQPRLGGIPRPGALKPNQECESQESESDEVSTARNRAGQPKLVIETDIHESESQEDPEVR